MRKQEKTSSRDSLYPGRYCNRVPSKHQPTVSTLKAAAKKICLLKRHYTSLDKHCLQTKLGLSILKQYRNRIQHKAMNGLNDRASIVEWCKELYLRQSVQAGYSAHRLLSEVCRLLFFHDVRVTSTAKSRSMYAVIPSLQLMSPMS